MPDCPLEPLVRAVQTLQPDFDFHNVDIVSDRQCLKQLYNFISGEKKIFQFGVEVVGSTTLFTRREPESRETIPLNTFAGYRQSFEESYTKLHQAASGWVERARGCLAANCFRSSKIAQTLRRQVRRWRASKDRRAWGGGSAKVAGENEGELQGMYVYLGAYPLSPLRQHQLSEPLFHS